MKAICMKAICIKEPDTRYKLLRIYDLERIGFYVSYISIHFENKFIGIVNVKTLGEYFRLL